MDDVLSALFVACVVAIAVVFAIAIAAVGATAGAALATGMGVSAFAGSLGRSVMKRGGARRVPTAPEPAFDLYVLSQLQRDMRLAFAEGWAALQRFRARCSRVADGWSEGVTWPLAGGVVVGGWLGAGAAAVVSVLVATPVVIVAGFLNAGAWVLIGALRAADWLRGRILGTHYECPEDSERFPLPVYLCPACHAEHRRLIPGRWGLLRRECECGTTSLPTMVLNGRQRIPQRCPSGHAMTGLIGYAQNLRVALVGGPSAGKSTFLAAAVIEFEQLAGTGSVAIDVVDESRVAYENVLTSLHKGSLPRQTTPGRRPALVAEVQGRGRSRVLYAYDVAGESYGSSDEVRELRFLEVPSGLVLLVDPLAIPHVAAQYSDEIEANKIAVLPSPEDPMRVLERTAAALAEAGVESRKIPVAVVLTKADAFGIGDEIRALAPEPAEHATRNWLVDHGASNFVRAVENEFRAAGWFASSALGRMPSPGDSRPFTPQGASAPLFWLLGRLGFMPANSPFTPSQTQDALDSGDARASAPIGAVGWGWRAGLSGLSVVGLLAAMTIGVASLVGQIGGPANAGASETGRVVSASDAPRALRRTLNAWGRSQHARQRCPLMTTHFRRETYGGSKRTAARRCRRDRGVRHRRRYRISRVRLWRHSNRAAIRVKVRRSGERSTIRFAKTSDGWRVNSSKAN